MNFEDLGLGSNILKAIEERGYTEPTPIQAKAIPTILMTRDVVGLAQTGTGKTASFILPMIEILHGGRAKARMPRSLVLSPTRELAAQIADNFEVYGKYHKLDMALLTGGSSMNEQMKKLDRGVDVLIATPGRLLDLFDRGHILLNDIKIFVVDEADRMMDMGFIPDIEKIVSLIPPIRQTLLFSATMPPEIKKLSDKFLSNPKEISVASTSAPAETVNQSLVWCGRRDKKQILHKILQKEKPKNAFVFCNRKKDISELAKFLNQKGFSSEPMHGDLAQAQRTETLERFKNDEVTLLICSDVAARGLDVAGVSHVFNYDVPMHAEDYVHRIGRTGRAGQDGRAWSIAVTGYDDKFVGSIERMMKRPIKVETLDGSDDNTSKSNEKSSPKEKDSSSEERSGSGGRRTQYGRKPKPRNDDKQNKSSDNRNKNNNNHKKTESSDNRKQTTHKKHTDQKTREKPRYNSQNDFADGANSFGDDLPEFLRKK